MESIHLNNDDVREGGAAMTPPQLSIKEEQLQVAGKENDKTFTFDSGYEGINCIKS